MSGFKLYEISEELMTLEDMLYDDTVDQETVGHLRDDQHGL